MENLPHFPALSPPFVLFARGRVRVAGPMCRVRSRSFRIEGIDLRLHTGFGTQDGERKESLAHRRYAARRLMIATATMNSHNAICSRLRFLVLLGAHCGAGSCSPVNSSQVLPARRRCRESSTGSWFGLCPANGLPFLSWWWIECWFAMQSAFHLLHLDCRDQFASCRPRRSRICCATCCSINGLSAKACGASSGSFSTNERALKAIPSADRISSDRSAFLRPSQ